MKNVKRLIPCIFIHNGKAVKWFDNQEVLSDDVVALAKQYNDNGADELIVFDLSKTDWVYVHYNSDGEPQIGFIDNDFQGITLESSSDRMVCTPKRESANFYSSLVRAEVNVEFVKENLGVEMELSEVKCVHFKQNNQCIGARCPFKCS